MEKNVKQIVEQVIEDVKAKNPGQGPYPRGSRLLSGKRS